jgi:hypothetical protein
MPWVADGAAVKDDRILGQDFHHSAMKRAAAFCRRP